MFAFLYRRLGIILAILCVGVSWVLSLNAAYDPDLGWISALLITIACVAEPSKLVANRLLWHPRSTRTQRLFASIWYAGCVLASVGLMHLLAEKQLAARALIENAQVQHETGQVVRWKERHAELRADLKAAEAAAEEARGAVLPGVRPLATLRQLLDAREAPSRAQRTLIEQELNNAQLNLQRETNAKRADERSANLRKSLAVLEAERPAASGGRPAEHSVRSVSGVRSVSDSLTVYALLSAILIELAITLGVLTDTVCNAVPEKPAEKIEQNQQSDGPGVRPDAAQTLALNAERFETWLQLEWRKHRARDGWLEGTQREWAAASGATSPGFVHEQLDRLQQAGTIEKRASTRKTWIRFVKVARLKFAN